MFTFGGILATSASSGMPGVREAGPTSICTANNKRKSVIKYNNEYILVVYEGRKFKKFNIIVLTVFVM